MLDPAHRFKPAGAAFSDAALRAQPGLSIADVMGLPLARTRELFRRLHLPAPLDEASDLLLEAIRARTDYLVDVGLDYLTLDRQSRTLSGGEVQRINLTTALGTSLVNTLFVLDEPSIGLHPRDMDRIIGVMHRLRDAGNSLLVVEHDPQVMHAADRVLDIGPGPGERGGEIVFQGTPGELMRADNSLTARLPHRPAEGRGAPSARCGRAGADPPAPTSACASGARARTTSSASTWTCPWSAWWWSPASAARASRRSWRACSIARCASSRAIPARCPAPTRPSPGTGASTTRCSSTSRRSVAPRAPHRRATWAPSTPSAGSSPASPRRGHAAIPSAPSASTPATAVAPPAAATASSTSRCSSSPTSTCAARTATAAASARRSWRSRSRPRSAATRGRARSRTCWR
ncbi:MAG: hypothetical protein U5K43_13715 [Halofilum sp. (in: g-proteobacteria)]|nr:hypothetical protein [Halofilum sp. (in: g-proteobacteria)]